MSQLATTLLGGLLGGTVLFVATALVTRSALIKKRPALVSAMWLVVLARFVLPIPIAGGLSIEARIAGLLGDADWIFPAPALAAESAATTAGASGLSLTSILLIGWALISLLLFLSTARSLWLTRRRLGALAPAGADVQERAGRIAARMRLSRVPRIVTGASSPQSCGVLSPVIAIPAWLEERDLDAVLGHELAHVRRRDPLWALFARAAEIALFFWPLVWLASRRFAAAREAACDAAALEATGANRRAYARTLVAVSSQLLSTRGSAMAMAARPSALAARIGGLLANARAGVGVVGAMVLAVQIVVGLPGSAKDAEAATPWGECVVVPGMGAEILSEFPDADRDGDGTLSRAEICAHQERLRGRVSSEAAMELFSEALAPICIETLRCSEGDEDDVYDHL